MLKDPESRRMKRNKAIQDPRVGENLPSFLQEGKVEVGGQSTSARQPKSTNFRPSWMIQGKDSMMSDTKLAQDWSVHSILPVDFKDFILSKDLEGVDLLGAQAHVAVKLLFPSNC